MRFLAYTAPERGHLYPVVPTLLELRRRGHEVAVRTGSFAIESLRSLGLRASAVGAAVEALEYDDWRARTPIGAIRRDARATAERGQVEIPDLELALEEERPDALIVETTTWGAAAVAEASGLPWAYFAHFCLPLPSRDAPPYGLGLAPRNDRIGRTRDAMAQRLVFRPLEGIAKPHVNAVRARLGLQPVRDARELFLAAPLVLAYTAEPFEYPRSDWPDQVRLVGPGVWDPPAPPPPWLDDLEPPLVLVTCSSEFQDDRRLAEVALAGLADELSVVVTTGGVDPAGFRSRPNVRVQRFASHGPILSRAACVVCHGGMGITQKALAAGVPVCAVPFGRDQFEVARRVEVAEAGTRLPASRLRPDRLRVAVREAMGKRTGAALLAAAFAEAGGPGLASDLLCELVGRRARS